MCIYYDIVVSVKISKGLIQATHYIISDKSVETDLNKLTFKMSTSSYKTTSTPSSTKKTHKYSCKRCKKRYKTKGGLNLHLKQHYPEKYLLQCPDCTFTTFQTGNLSKHTKVIHHKDIDGQQVFQDIRCTSCEFVCFTEEQLKNHTLRKHTSPEEVPFKCTDCDYDTVEKAALAKHNRICHTNVRPFPCEFCRMRFNNTSALARHHRSHEGVKPYQCHLCSMCYADRKRLKDHLLKHSNEKPFSCPSCKYSTNRNDNLKTHIKRNHMPPENVPILNFQ